MKFCIDIDANNRIAPWTIQVTLGIEVNNWIIDHRIPSPDVHENQVSPEFVVPNLKHQDQDGTSVLET